MLHLIAFLWLAAAGPAAPADQVQVTLHRQADGTHALVHETRVEAPVREVWRAISTAEGWAGWAAPVAHGVEGHPDLIETSYAADAAPGDARTIRQLVLVRIPERAMVFRTVKAPEGFPHFDTYRSVVSIFEVEPLGDTGSVVRLTTTGYADTEAGRRLVSFFREGNRVSLEQLRKSFSSARHHRTEPGGGD